MDWLIDDALIDGAGLSVARMTVPPGVCSERHSHPNCSEVIHLIEGEIEQHVGSDCHVMTAGDTAFIPPDSPHQTRNIGTGPAVMVISYSAGSRVYIPDEES